MKARVVIAGLLLATLVSSSPARAQLARTNAIWARTAPAGSITLDGNLNEPVWSAAETWLVGYRKDNGIPGSGWKDEGGFLPNQPTNDSTKATLRFLVMGNRLYLGATVPDRSIGGSGQFGWADGFLMALKDHAASGFPKPPNEYLYSWWYPRQPDLISCAQSVDSAVGNPPIFKGRWAPDPVCEPDGPPVVRTAEQIAAWDARTVVNGITNSDAAIDVGYTVEMVFDLAVMGYDVTQTDGDIIEWNISIYDADNYWKVPTGNDLVKNRAWWQSPWGLIAEHDEVRIYAKPSVTTSSGALPAIDPDFRIPTTASAAPTIDGTLSDAVWASAPSLEIQWDDAALRASYSAVGKWRSGQYQPRLAINNPEPNPLPIVGDGGNATVKYFWKGDFLYLGFDVPDIRVQSNAIEDQWDGFTVSITHRTERDLQDHNLQGKALCLRVGTAGAVTVKDLTALVGAGNAQVALVPKAGTTVDSTGTTNDDTGYTAELRVDLKALGYAPGLGDHTMFLGITHHDHDRFSNPLTASYSTRTWWYREREEQCCPAWTLLDGTYIIGTTTGVDGVATAGFQSFGNTPNPFRVTTSLDFALGRPADLSLVVFDAGGRVVERRSLGRFLAGRQQVPVSLPGIRSGLYLYRVEARDPANGATLANLRGKMMILR
jgi:hypothetical protein